VIWELALSHAECHGICCFCSKIINYCLIVYFCRFNISHFSNLFVQYWSNVSNSLAPLLIFSCCCFITSLLYVWEYLVGYCYWRLPTNDFYTLFWICLPFYDPTFYLFSTYITLSCLTYCVLLQTQRDTTGLTTENRELKLRLQSMEEQAKLRDGMLCSSFETFLDLLVVIIDCSWYTIPLPRSLVMLTNLFICY